MRAAFPSAPSSPSFVTDFVVVGTDGNIEHEPPSSLRDRLNAAVADGDVGTTEDLLERIQTRSGWCGEIDARTHFDILQAAFEVGVRAGHEATSTACLRAMAQDAELKEVARDGLPATLSLGGSRSDQAFAKITPEVLGCRIRHIAQAAVAGLVSPRRAAALLTGDGPQPLLRAVLGTPDRFRAAVQAYACAGREKVVRGEPFKSLMQARHDGETLLLCAARQDLGQAVFDFMDAAHAVRRRQAIDENTYLQLITEGRDASTVVAALCAPPGLLHLDNPTTALESYLKGLLTARLPGAVTLSERAFAKILLAPGGDGQPAIAQCGRDQAAMIRSKLKDALDMRLLKPSTVADILRHLPLAEVDELSGEDAALAWQHLRGPSRF